MQVNIKDIGGEVVKEDDRYTVKDNTSLRNLALSSTFLTAGKSTTGHAHVGQEEVYFFVDPLFCLFTEFFADFLIAGVFRPASVFLCFGEEYLPGSIDSRISSFNSC